jgi:hypothetical protein
MIRLSSNPIAVAVDYFHEDSTITPTHQLVPIDQWRGMESVVRAAKFVFDPGDPAAIDSKLKALRKAVEKYEAGG